MRSCNRVTFCRLRAMLTRLSLCRPYAVKIISKESGKFHKASLEKEVAILKAIEHPNCMRLYGKPACVLQLSLLVFCS